MKSIMIAVAAAMAMAVAGSASAAQANDLLKANGCAGCHDIAKKKVGPALSDVVAKAPAAGKERDAFISNLVSKVTGGKGHPNIKAKPEDVDKTLHAVVAEVKDKK